METPEKANMQAAQEYDTVEKHIHERVNAIHLVAEMFECSTDDVEIMLSLLRAHGVYEIIEAVEDFTDWKPVKWTFTTVVTAARDVTLKRLHDKINGDLYAILENVAIGTRPSVYGTAISVDHGLNEKTLMAFTDMIKYGVNTERITRLNKAYNDTEG